ncbi:MAG TPA: hypothetical protein VH475_23710 [Tepidisphaeraceae bacterium]|jgi:hypothetical protein
MNVRSGLLAIAVLAMSAFLARGQVIGVPVVGGGAMAFEPEIGVVNSGVINDVQATVSADRKYVTMTMRPSNSQLLNLFTFQFQAGPGGGGGIVQLPGGFVGGVNPVIAGPAGNVIPQRLNAPRRIAPGHGGAILLQRGITPLVLAD